MKLIIRIFIFICCFPFFSNAQKSSPAIENIDLDYQEGKIMIRFELKNSIGNAKYKPNIEIFYSDGRKIPASSYIFEEEDHYLKSGYNKVYWDVQKDGIVINDEIYVT